MANPSETVVPVTNEDRLLDLVDDILGQDISDIEGFSNDEDADPLCLPIHFRDLGASSDEDNTADSTGGILASKEQTSSQQNSTPKSSSKPKTSTPENSTSPQCTPKPGPSLHRFLRPRPSPPVVSTRCTAQVTDLIDDNRPNIQNPVALAESTPTTQPPFQCYKKWNTSEQFNPLPAAPPLEHPNDDDTIVTPLTAFQRYVPEALIEEMALATSQKILANTAKQFVVTPQIMKQFIGINIVMSYMKYPRIRMYWAQKTRVSQIADVMKRDTFFLIRNNLTCRDYCVTSQEEKDRNKFWKIAPILESVRSACLANSRSENVSMDEQMIPFHGHVSMRQFVKGKPNPIGLKNFVSTAPDGLPLDFFLYQGKGDKIKEVDPKLELELGGKVVLKLAETLPEGCNIYMDRFFTSITVLEELFALGMHGTGPLQKTRIPIECNFVSDSELRARGRGSFDQQVRDDGQITCIKWMDSNFVVIASTNHGSQPVDVVTRWSKTQKQYVQVRRPHVIAQYNKNMGGIDLLDRMIAYYRIAAKTKRWTVRAIFHFIDFSLAASWIERKRADELQMTPKRDRLDFLDFKVEVAHELLTCGAVHGDIGEVEVEDDDDGVEEAGPTQKRRKVIPLPPDSVRTTAALHLPEIPVNGKLSRCRLPGCGNQKCRFWCITCKMFLCLNNNRNCFKVFHEL